MADEGNVRAQESLFYGDPAEGGVKTPKFKIQTPKKHQISKYKLQAAPIGRRPGKGYKVIALVGT
jgi:hypothetical protein